MDAKITLESLALNFLYNDAQMEIWKYDLEFRREDEATGKDLRAVRMHRLEKSLELLFFIFSIREEENKILKKNNNLRVG